MPIEFLSCLNTSKAHLRTGASNYDLLTFTAHLKTRGVLFKAIGFLLGEPFSNRRHIELNQLDFKLTSNNKIEQCQSLKTGKTVKIQDISIK